MTFRLVGNGVQPIATIQRMQRCIVIVFRTLCDQRENFSENCENNFHTKDFGKGKWAEAARKKWQWVTSCHAIQPNTSSRKLNKIYAQKVQMQSNHKLVVKNKTQFTAAILNFGARKRIENGRNFTSWENENCRSSPARKIQVLCAFKKNLIKSLREANASQNEYPIKVLAFSGKRFADRFKSTAIRCALH